MGSHSRSPKTRHRFGFSGSLTRPKKDRVTTDDILASLTRQAELRQKLGERDQVALEEIAEMENLSRFQGFYLNPNPLRLWMRKKDSDILCSFSCYYAD
jgi:hypothetical protein